ncbi:MAG: DUF402 domain-containing protein [Chloroflexi bacterium]|nr:DUF402 domain-containing protein [Chloroflexota bacterium]
MSESTVIKCNHLGEEVFRWSARVIERSATHVLAEAYFGLENHFMGEIPLEPGDRFIETYYSDRWYNRYEVHARQDDRLKCWYCNLAYPTDLGEEVISFRDLALDLLVLPDGRQQLLDEAEFEALDISPEDRQTTLTALDEIRSVFRRQFTK